ncbi:hypothetical protein B4113_0810 [Geobacillus sp. B4113_201601]|nr:hypothetical protein B4113_0810 [Geobacillus sp. B4113_201601]
MGCKTNIQLIIAQGNERFFTNVFGFHGHRRLVKNRCHTRIGGMFIQKRKLIVQGFSN